MAAAAAAATADAAAKPAPTAAVAAPAKGLCMCVSVYVCQRVSVSVCMCGCVYVCQCVGVVMCICVSVHVWLSVALTHSVVLIYLSLSLFLALFSLSLCAHLPRSGDVMRERELQPIRKRLARRRALTLCLSHKGSSPSDIWERLKKTTDANIAQLPTLADLWGTCKNLANWLETNAPAKAEHNKVGEEESVTDR